MRRIALTPRSQNMDLVPLSSFLWQITLADTLVSLAFAKAKIKLICVILLPRKLLDQESTDV